MNKYKDLLEELEKNNKAAMLTTLSDKCEKEIVTDESIFAELPEVVKKAFYEGKPVMEQKKEKITVAEPFCKEERFIILGGGHISLALADFAAKIGFSVTVVDDRPSFANKVRFPLADKVICDSFESAIPKLGIQSMDYIVLVTRGHKYDGVCLRKLAKETETKYLGMIGSKRRVAGLKDVLCEEGIDRVWLEKIHTPIGLPIGAVTPEEISIAILAEIIQVRRMPKERDQKSFTSDIELEVIEKLADVPQNRIGVKKATVTVIETKGSTPRKAGAKMIVYEDGLTEGTIGGGCAEANLAAISREVIRNGGYRLETVNLTNDIAAEEGMVCGGIMTVLIEAVEDNVQ